MSAVTIIAAEAPARWGFVVLWPCDSGCLLAMTSPRPVASDWLPASS